MQVKIIMYIAFLWRYILTYLNTYSKYNNPVIILIWALLTVTSVI